MFPLWEIFDREFSKNFPFRVFQHFSFRIFLFLWSADDLLSFAAGFVLAFWSASISNDRELEIVSTNFLVIKVPFSLIGTLEALIPYFVLVGA